MLTMVRKSNLVNTTWDEIDFVTAEWTIPAKKMKVSRQGAGRPHIVYLSQQAATTCTGQWFVLCVAAHNTVQFH